MFGGLLLSKGRVYVVLKGVVRDEPGLLIQLRGKSLEGVTKGLTNFL